MLCLYDRRQSIFYLKGNDMKHCFKFFLFLGIFVFAVEAKADLNVDARALYDRMDRLERDITLMQRKLYKGGQNAGGSHERRGTGFVANVCDERIKVGELRIKPFKARLNPPFEYSGVGCLRTLVGTI